MARPSTPHITPLAALAGFVVSCLIAGLLAAALFIPFTIGVGKTTEAGVTYFEELPSDFGSGGVTQQTRIVTADGKQIAAPFGENRVVVESDQISPWMKKAQVAIEDERFTEHNGADLTGIARALVNNFGGGGTQGGSTLTQQYVKVSLQDQALREGDLEAARRATTQNGLAGYARKLREIKYAVSLEKTHSKDEILTNYLNLVYYGDRAYGVEAAAQHYFSVPAADLTIAQSALLAGIVKSPGASDPISNPERALDRRNVVLFKMRELGDITDEQYEEAVASDLGLDVSYTRRSCATSDYPFVCIYVVEWLLRQQALGETESDRRTRLDRGGLTITTTFDSELLDRATKELRDAVPAENDNAVAAAVAVVEPGTGKVRAIAQNREYGFDRGSGQTAVGYSVDRPYTTSSGFAIGSTAKLYSAVTAIRDGFPVDGRIGLRDTVDLTSINSRGEEREVPKAVFRPQEFAECADVADGELWAVQNDHGRFSDSIDFKEATEESVNTAFSELTTALSPCRVRDTMTSMGLHRSQLDENGEYVPFSAKPGSVALGADEASPLSLATSFATVASGGTRCTPYPVESIADFEGTEIPLDAQQCERVLEEGEAAAVTEVFRSVPETTDGGAARARLSGGRVSAGKTGTADGSDETWYSGYTPQLAASVWVGTPDSLGNLRDIQLGDRTYPGWLYGSTLAAPTFRKIMDFAHRDLPNESFPTPPEELRGGTLVDVPDVSGMTVLEARDELRKAGLLALNTKPWAPGDATIERIETSHGEQQDTAGFVKLTPRTDAEEPTPEEIRQELEAQGDAVEGSVSDGDTGEN